jgi:hypothetical protein
MSSPTITKGYTFPAKGLVTNTYLHLLLDLATWAITDQDTGDIAYFDGTDWVRLAAGSEGDVLTIVEGVPAWVTPK